jgi:hypothetical protein
MAWITQLLDPGQWTTLRDRELSLLDCYLEGYVLSEDDVRTQLAERIEQAAPTGNKVGLAAELLSISNVRDNAREVAQQAYREIRGYQGSSGA